MFTVLLINIAPNDFIFTANLNLFSKLVYAAHHAAKAFFCCCIHLTVVLYEIFLTNVELLGGELSVLLWIVLDFEKCKKTCLRDMSMTELCKIEEKGFDWEEVVVLVDERGFCARTFS